MYHARALFSWCPPTCFLQNSQIPLVCVLSLYTFTLSHSHPQNLISVLISTPQRTHHYLSKPPFSAHYSLFKAFPSAVHGTETCSEYTQHVKPSLSWPILLSTALDTSPLLSQNSSTHCTQTHATQGFPGISPHYCSGLEYLLFISPKI